MKKINIFNLEHYKIDGHECMCRGSMSHCVKPKKKKFKHSASINVEKKPTYFSFSPHNIRHDLLWKFMCMSLELLHCTFSLYEYQFVCQSFWPYSLKKKIQLQVLWKNSRCILITYCSLFPFCKNTSPLTKLLYFNSILSYVLSI